MSERSSMEFCQYSVHTPVKDHLGCLGSSISWFLVVFHHAVSHYKQVPVGPLAFVDGVTVGDVFPFRTLSSLHLYLPHISQLLLSQGCMLPMISSNDSYFQLLAYHCSFSLLLFPSMLQSWPWSCSSVKSPLLPSLVWAPCSASSDLRYILQLLLLIRPKCDVRGWGCWSWHLLLHTDSSSCLLVFSPVLVIENLLARYSLTLCSEVTSIPTLPTFLVFSLQPLSGGCCLPVGGCCHVLQCGWWSGCYLCCN